ncbi:hypothetical protein IJI55_02520 [Candidatus Saccharibacteria bacterium]|nr:hypothetical protein [Candidatus Saccharibacteria bacterium]MBR0403397.1 hypothetical protein [Candidatus Saccharibacteria bacterium]
MISPETFIKTYENKSYDQLLVIRQSLLNDIYAFETAKPKDAPESNIPVWPAEEVVYQSDLKYLAKVCELIAEKHSLEKTKA